MKEELLKGLSEEQIAKIKACKNSEELLDLVVAALLCCHAEQLAVLRLRKVFLEIGMQG